jgi:hypothetical protein
LIGIQQNEKDETTGISTLIFEIRPRFFDSLTYPGDIPTTEQFQQLEGFLLELTDVRNIFALLNLFFDLFIHLEEEILHR